MCINILQMNENLFWYFVIFILILCTFSQVNIGTNFIFGSLVGLFVIVLLYLYDKKEQMIENKKKEFIRPLPKNSKKEIISFLFSIQDFYEYNPIAYENMVEGLDQFFDRYNEILKDVSLAGISYENLIEEKRHVINSLHSIIFKLPSNRKYDKKLENAIKSIEYFLQIYLDNVEKINNEYIYNKGIINTSKFIKKTKVQPINFYTDEDFSSYEMV